MTTAGTSAADPSIEVPFSEALRVWARIGVLSFGGPSGQIALMHRILVEEKRWISETRFLHALNYCMLLPGPEAQQLATYVGWLLHRTKGGLAAGTLFVLPGFFVILLLAMLYAGFQRLAVVDALFFGVKAAVLAIVVEALQRIAKRALKNGVMYAIAAGAFLGIFVFDLPFPAIVLGAGSIGFAAGSRRPELFVQGAQTDGGKDAGDDAVVDRMIAAGRADHTLPDRGRAGRVLIVGLAFWFVPISLLAVLLGSAHVYVQAAVFFSKMAVVTFGGAYAVLAYVAQQAVEVHGWLAPGEMLDGLGLAETTPGPLILVLQFVGFLAAWREAGALSPVVAGTLGAVVTVWVTFVPCFLWIFLGGPYVEALRGKKALAAALAAITAAVVGVILNLALWFGLHVVFAELRELRGFGVRLLVPVWSSLDPAALALTIAAMVALLRLHLGMLPTLAGCAVLGAAWRLWM